MPLYEVRLEAQDGSGHFRVTRLQAEDKAEARKRCERAELRLVLFELDDGQAAALLERYEEKAGRRVDHIDDLPTAAPLDASDEEKAAFREIDGADRARLTAHYQQEPYKVTDVAEVKGR